MAYWAMVASLTLTTYRLLPSGATARSCGAPPPATVAGDFGVSLPVAGLMLYCQMVLAPVAATYALLPSGAIVIICGPSPVATVCTGLALSVPVAVLIPNTETVLALAMAVHPLPLLPLLPFGALQFVPLVM